MNAGHVGGRRIAALAVLIAWLAQPVAQARSAREFGDGPLAASQARYSRVSDARRRQGARLDDLFAKAGLAYSVPVLVRAFKHEGILELWGLSAAAGRYVRVASWPFTGYSGDLGPKRRRWDRQIPEGFYRVAGFNGASRYHLSLLVDYPNASDRIKSQAQHLGNNIFIHGDEWTSGCIPIGNRAIELLYLPVLDATDAGHVVPVHLFPCRFGTPSCDRLLRSVAKGKPKLEAFWENLREGAEAFERTGLPPAVHVAPDGGYLFGPPVLPTRLALPPCRPDLPSQPSAQR